MTQLRKPLDLVDKMYNKYVDKVWSRVFRYCVNDSQEISMRFTITLFVCVAVLFLGPTGLNKTLGSPWDVSGLISGLKVKVTTKEKAVESSWYGEKANIFRVPNTSEHLSEFFDWLGHDLKDGNRVVQPVFVQRFPPDYSKLKSTDQRKELFVEIVLPLILRENARILSVRERIIELSRKDTLSKAEEDWLEKLYSKYRVKNQKNFQALLHRVDVVPAGLALAQAANESGWGTSRFSRLGNAVYGQWTWSSDDEGIVPLERAENKRHRIRAFDELYASVRSYMLNLNRHRSYKPFREIRKEFKSRGRSPNSYIMAQGLINYSTKREQYVTHLRSLLTQNDFSRYDSYILNPYIEIPGQL